MESETKTKLLQATRSLIDEEGLEAVTLRAVGARAGLSRGAAYRHFKDKEGLLAAIAKENIEQILRALEELLELDIKPIEAVRRLLLQTHSYGLANKVHYQLMFSTYWNSERFTELHDCGKKVFEKAHQLISKFLGNTQIDPSRTLYKTTISYAFIHGLIELHLAGHVQEMKGLDNTEKLIEEFLATLSAT